MQEHITFYFLIDIPEPEPILIHKCDLLAKFLYKQVKS